MPFMAEHSGFEKLVAEAKKKITEISPTEAAAKSKSGEAVIIDVREKDEWDEEHIPDATHMSRGTIELDIEEKVPDSDAMIICHCGGGGRSALAAENLQKMGYKNVRSMAGGFKSLESRRLANDQVIVEALVPSAFRPAFAAQRSIVFGPRDR